MVESIVFMRAMDAVDVFAPVDAARSLRYRMPMESAFGLTIPRTLEDVCNTRDMALLVYDMQVGIVSQVPKGPAVVARVRDVLTVARASHMRVFFTRHLSLPRELMGAFQYRTAMSWQRVESPDQVKPWFLRGSPAFEIVPELTPLPSEGIFDKITMSAFEGTPLSIALRDCGIRALAVVGLAIEVGIEPTARHAADLGLIPVIVADACGSGREDAARRSLDSLEFAGDSILTNVDEFRRLLRPR
jgi:nicotinamidase-related amidase